MSPPPIIPRRRHTSFHSPLPSPVIPAPPLCQVSRDDISFPAATHHFILHCRRRSFPHHHYAGSAEMTFHFPLPPHVIPAPPHVIPAKAGTSNLARHAILP